MRTTEEIYNDISIMKQRADEYCTLYKEFYDYIHFVKEDDCYNNSVKQPMIIWTVWLQGIKNAPEIVQACYKSLMKLNEKYEIILITKDNLNEYVTLNPIIEKKWEAGIISNTAISNIIRLELLCKYGGIWVDGTVLCTTEEIPDYITNVPLFMYSSWKWITGDIRPVSTWFIAAKPHHPILETTKKGLIYYWERKNKLDTYFIFHMFFRMVISEYPELWHRVPRFSNIPPHMLQFELGNEYNDQRYKEINNMASFHKLTYKLPESIMENKNSFYKKILSLY